MGINVLPFHVGTVAYLQALFEKQEKPMDAFSFAHEWCKPTWYQATRSQLQERLDLLLGELFKHLVLEEADLTYRG